MREVLRSGRNGTRQNKTPIKRKSGRKRGGQKKKTAGER